MKKRVPQSLGMLINCGEKGRGGRTEKTPVRTTGEIENVSNFPLTIFSTANQNNKRWPRRKEGRREGRMSL